MKEGLGFTHIAGTSCVSKVGTGKVPSMGAALMMHTILTIQIWGLSGMTTKEADGVPSVLLLLRVATLICSTG